MQDATSRSTARLGCYVLPGGVKNPKAGLREAIEAERLGLGTVWIGERYDTKDLPSLAGALSQITSKVGIAAGITHPGLRHPMVLASMGQTLQALTDGRFTLGIGRSAAWRWRQYGAPAPTLRSLADTAQILRRLWAGDTVDYDGPLGRFPELRLAQRAEVTAPRVLLAAVGPRTLALAGEAFDGVILHPFLTVDAVARSVAIVRQAAERTGRDPMALRCCATVVVAPARTAHEAALAVAARATGYFQLPGLGDVLAAANRWSTRDLTAFRAQPKLAALGSRSADKTLSRDELIELSHGMPPEWLPSSSASGSADACAARLRDYLDAGADDLIMHGTTADHLQELVHAFG